MAQIRKEIKFFHENPFHSVHFVSVVKNFLNTEHTE